MTKWCLVGLIVSANACGDLMNTFGMRRYGTVRSLAPAEIGRLTRALAGNRFVLAGVAAMAVSFFALMTLLSIANVSFAVPATSGSFLLETAAARIILKEQVRWQRWVGAAVVACGMGLLALP